MSYSYLSKEKVGKRWYVTVRIEGVYARLSLPIEMSLKLDPPGRLYQHNLGHAAICKRVYEDADKHMRSSIRSVLRKAYSGEGDTVDEASAQAVALATNELVESYKKNTQETAQDVSDAYDFLELNRPQSYEKSVEQAFQVLHSGRTRRL